MSKPPSQEHYACPACGAEVRVGADRCSQCSPPKPWEQDEIYDGLDGDFEEDFDYQEYVEREFGEEGSPRGARDWFWWCVALGLLFAFGWMSFVTG